MPAIRRKMIPATSRFFIDFKINLSSSFVNLTKEQRYRAPGRRFDKKRRIT
jgi:hypothetical protein